MKPIIAIVLCLLNLNPAKGQGNAAPAYRFDTARKNASPSVGQPATGPTGTPLKTAAAEPKLVVDGKIKAAEGALDDAAIEVAGAIKVSGSNKAAFQVSMTVPGSNYFQVNAGGYVVDYYRITTPMTANDPAAIIVATPVSSVLSYPFWVGYDAANTIGGGNGQWYIAEPRYNGQGGFPNGTRFNVMIMKQ